MRNDKLKDMIRSILPSKNREAARLAKALESRRVRRSVRSDLRRQSLEDARRQASQSENVSWRRGGDKLNHFMRWCESITERMTTQDAIDHVRSLLPRNVVGDHAYQHWERHRRRRDHVEPMDVREFLQRCDQSVFDKVRFRLRRALARDPSLHARLNAEIKRRKKAGEPRRLLMGVHDIDAFVRTVWLQHEPRWPGVFDLERRLTLELIAEVKKNGG